MNPNNYFNSVLSFHVKTKFRTHFLVLIAFTLLLSTNSIAQQLTFDLSDLDGTNGTAFNGPSANIYSGRAITTGDFNDDGKTDIAIGAALASTNGSSSGAVYIAYGSDTPFTSDYELSSIDSLTGFTVKSIDQNDKIGTSLATGDINGDGIDDLIIGAGSAGTGNANGPGHVYVIFGKDTTYSEAFSLSNLDGTNGFIITGETNGDNFGQSVATGDVNNDGYDDILIGASNYEDVNGIYSANGAVYLYYGKPSGYSYSTAIADEITNSNATFFEGKFAIRLGSQIEIGDINNDNYGDIIIGSENDSPNGGASGSIYVVYGSGTKFSSKVILGDISSNGTGLQIKGAAGNHRIGTSVSYGDINNDGINDILFGAASLNKAFVVYGKNNLPSTIEMSAFADSIGFTIESDIVGQRIGYSIASGDLNNDSIDDILIGAYYSDLNGTDTGTSYIIFGKKSSFGDGVNVTDLKAQEGLVIYGENTYDRSGEKVAIGDVNNDGIEDALIGSSGADPNGSSSGAVFAYFNSPTLTLDVSEGSLSLDGIDDYATIAHSSDFDNLSEFTIETWVYLNSYKRNGIIEKHNSLYNGWWLHVETDIKSVIVTNNGELYINSTVNPQLNTWNHIAVTYNGTNLAIYLNGENVSGSNIGVGSGVIVNNTNDIHIGVLNWTDSNLNGKLDEIRIWNTARTEDEIKSTMFESLSGDETNLIGYWSFDKVNSNSSDDLSKNNNTVTLNGATHSSTNHPYGAFITGDEGWRMMSIPVSGVSYGEVLDTLWTQGFTGADVSTGNSNVLVWNENSSSFTSISNASDIPTAGSGFITYVYDDHDFDGTGDGFPKMIKTNSSQNNGSISPTISFTDSGILANDGWNLVGNPYGSTVQWDVANGWNSTNLDASFYVWSDSANSGSGAYLTWNGITGTFGNGELAPWQGFWVKANAENPSLSINDNVRSTGGILRKQAPVSQIKFSLEGETLSSQALIMFNENASIEKDRYDAYKLQSLNKDYLNLFTTLEDGSALDINALPASLEEAISIPLDLDGSDLVGSFNLSWNTKVLPQDWSFTLVDNFMGEEIDMMEVSSVEFELQKSSKATGKENTDEESLHPIHRLVRPSVVSKTKSEQSRFTLRIVPFSAVTNETGLELPVTVELQQNYPNPFNPTTTIAFGIPESGKVTLEVFDVLGRKVATLINGENKVAGRHTINFDAQNLASGMYIYRLQAGNSIITKKLTLIK